VKETICDRIDAVTKIGETRLKMGGIQPAPKSVKIELTARCSLRCKYCAVRTRTKPPKADMDFYYFQKITEDMRISGVEEIGLFYLGESFMNPILLLDAVKWCKRLGFQWIFLTSNAVNADSWTVRQCMDAGLDSLKWSVNWADLKQFQEVTGGSEAQYANALEHIREAWQGRASNGKMNTIISASSILYEGEQLAKMKTMLDENVRPFVDKHYWLPLYQMSMYKDKIEKELGYVPTAGNCGRIDDETLQPTRPPLPCWCTLTEGHVRVDGGLSACGFGADERFDMGVLDGTNFMRQWNSPKFVALREAQLRTIKEGQDALKGTICEVCVAFE
jgi:uncharacterized Fe-S cluster-containing radical SAM superfamily protein